MRIIGVRGNVSKNVLVTTLRKHMTTGDINHLATSILEGAMVQLDDDWALEQDLKDLGVKVG
mgnify:CR=1 FL=1